MGKSNVWLMAASLVCLSVCTSNAVASSDDRVVAKFNGKALMKSEVVDALKTMGNGKLPNDKKDFEDLDTNAKDQIIRNQAQTKILFDAAQGSKFVATPDFKKKMDLFNKSITVQLYLDHEARQKVTPSMVRDKYSDYVKALKEHDDRKVAQILVNNEDEANKISAELNNKTISFDDAVKKYSVDAGSKDKGGEVGVLSYGSAHPEFAPIEKAVFATKKGEITAPIKTRLGWHIIKVVDTTKRKIPSFEEVKDGLEMEMIERQKQQQAAEMLKAVNVETFPDKSAVK